MNNRVVGLNQLLKSNPFIVKSALKEGAELDIAITTVTANSMQCRPGSLFVAVRGATKASRDGHDFIEQAIANGACAIVINDDFVLKKNYKVPIIPASDSKAALCYLVEAFYDYPSTHLKVIGITGTNGKTSTSFMLHSILKQAGFNPKIMGTLGMGDPGNLTALTHTTMDPEFISAHLSSMRNQGVTHVIMEISSHALSLKRVEALNFAAVALTNITQDHLDFHGTLLDYQRAKGRLFFELAKATTIKVLPVDHPFADLTADSLFGDDHKADITLPFLGAFHKKNASLAKALATCLGVSVDHIEQGLKLCPPIPGRMEPIPNTKHRKIFVDFAHTPDALASLLKSIRPLGSGKLFLVFGCGGDRDKSKRPHMGKIAESLADVVIVTDDNPRTEDAASIRKDILEGMTHPHLAHEFSERKSAIAYAIMNSESKDLVVIAGKGHENYQIYGNTHSTFSDQIEAKKVVDSL